MKIQVDPKVDEFIIDKLDKLHSWIKLPIGVGIVCSIIYIYNFGLHDYFKNLLEWIIGGTIVLIIINYITKNGDEKNA